VTARGRIIYVNLDDTGVAITVEWGAVSETIEAGPDSLQAAVVRKAAEDVVEQHLAHLGYGYTLGTPPPSSDPDEED
jgi:hypothetical protein